MRNIGNKGCFKFLFKFFITQHFYLGEFACFYLMNVAVVTNNIIALAGNAAVDKFVIVLVVFY